MPIFLMQKMENFIKKWSDLELTTVVNGSASDTAYRPTATEIIDKNNISEESNNEKSESNEKTPPNNYNNLESQKLNGLTKTQNSIDSIKAKTIVTPIDLEPNEQSSNLRSEVNIIKLENESYDANIVNLDGNQEISRRRCSETRSSKVLMYSNDENLENNENFEEIVDELFDWLLWMRHTLETQTVIVGDIDQIQQSINKFDVIFLILLKLIIVTL